MRSGRLTGPARRPSPAHKLACAAAAKPGRQDGLGRPTFECGPAVLEFQHAQRPQNWAGKTALAGPQTGMRCGRQTGPPRRPSLAHILACTAANKPGRPDGLGRPTNWDAQRPPNRAA
ncbi:hypothetical protein COCOBI_12-0020 [Coccomyxa sp. Obi]|nr:hypothetical protein COCOBI_12-0020 [Coccomyxa sp. Obi]